MNVIETERLILREMTIDDLPATREIVCDEQTMHAWNGAWSEEENLAGLQKQIRGYSEDGFGRWAVVLKETGKIIGICGLQWCDTDKYRVLEIGYLFNRAYWHKGYAAESAIACKEYAFDVLKYDEVFSLVRDTNYASMNVAIRNGMVVRGRFTKQYRGEDMPHYIFSARRKETNKKVKIIPMKAIGVAIDCEDENALADFYVRMLNWTKTYSGNGYAVVSSPNESFLLVFQAVEHYQPPVWPWEKGKQAQMMHFDFFVTNLDESVEHAKKCGASVCEVQFYEGTSVTMIDPAGHPFCLSTVWEEQLYAT